MQIIYGENVEVRLDESDVKSAIMAFICACHPEFSRGHEIDVHCARPAVALVNSQCLQCDKYSAHESDGRRTRENCVYWLCNDGSCLKKTVNDPIDDEHRMLGKAL